MSSAQARGKKTREAAVQHSKVIEQLDPTALQEMLNGTRALTTNPNGP
jgi:hypothetical protein